MSKEKQLERGYCQHFFKDKSYNANAGLKEKDLSHAEYILTLYKWFTRNSNTDMRVPISKRLLHDRQFVALAEAFVRKQMVMVPNLAAAL